MNVFVLIWVRIWRQKCCKFMPYVFLTTAMIYALYHAQHGNKTALGNQLPVISTRDISSLPTILPNSTTQTTSTITTPSSPIHFPLDIDLQKYVRDKIEKNIDIPAKPINKHGYTYIHRPPKCEFNKTTDDITLLILVKSSVRNVFLRNAIRDTWGAHLSGNIKLAFMLGYSSSHIETTKLEAETYHDVIVETFVDSYPNNTLKTIMGFNWAVTECKTASAILFIDEDHLPRVSNIMTYLHSLNPDQLTYLFCGYRIVSAYVNRGKHHWAVPLNVFPYKRWPPYLRGGAYLVSQNIARRFSTAFPFVQYLHVDDAYLGVVALKLDINVGHDGRFMMTKAKLDKKQAYFVYNDYKHPRDMQRDWKFVYSTM